MSERSFTLEDQRDFAALSGDWNPLHVDPLTARRSQFGRPLVHGMHLLLWALDQLVPTCPAAVLAKISCTIRNPVGIDEGVSCRLVEQKEAAFKIAIENSAGPCATLQFELAPIAQKAAVAFVGNAPSIGACRELSADGLSGARGTLPIEASPEQLRTHFPRLSAMFPYGQLALIVATTRLVGMECPGLHSIYSDLSIDFSESGLSEIPGQLDWSVDNYDERFRRLSIDFSTVGAKGAITAMLRPGPQSQPTTTELKEKLSRAGAFSGQKALVIGGSRGLGELCAKLLAAGGADVRLTYSRGKVDAEAVVADIRSAGENAAFFEYDIFNPEGKLAEHLNSGWQPSHVYYFPTPPIFVAARGKFSQELFSRFCQYYVEGFYACYTRVREITSEPVSLFYPSSVAVETVFPSMGEYAAAKAAGENLCKFIEACDRKVKVHVSRLPRLPSDQTLSVMEVETDAPIETMLAFIDNAKATGNRT